jgi:hypothetical protein
VKILITALGLLAAFYSLVGLYGVWRAPALFESRAYGPRMLTGALPNDRPNRILMLVWFLLLGVYLATSVSGFGLWSLIPWVGSMVAGVIAIRRVVQGRKGRPN